VIFEIVVSASATKTLAMLDRSTLQRIGNRIDEIATDPLGPRFSKALAYPKDSRVSRVGDWRIIYTADTNSRRVKIESIGSRGQVYRRL
jgi:mRNA-degrading endonuclease RelE of RelBE toxin-antitoxin system